MSEMGHSRHIFPGGNTPRGFFSYYDYILGQNDANRIIILKGGPGVGKSSFMRKIGEELSSQGFDIEYMHCSSDNNSLDGVVIPKIKVALIDGTAPHVVDPKNPGCIDEIIHLGDYWDEEGLRANRLQILETNYEIGRIFKRAYRYLNAAKSIYDDIEQIHILSMDFSKTNQNAQKISDEIFSGLYPSNTLGKARHLFASAITPDGLKNYLESIVYGMHNIYILKGEPGTGKSTLLAKVADTAISLGTDVELYHCPLDPEKAEHIVIPQLKTAIITSNEYHGIYKSSPASIINMNDFLDSNIISKYSEQLRYDRRVFNDLLSQAIATIGEAKKLHDILETYYTPNMNFSKIEEKRLQTLEKILRYTQQ